MSTNRRNQVSSNAGGIIQNKIIRGMVGVMRLALLLLVVIGIASAGSAWAGSADDDNANTPTGGR